MRLLLENDRTILLVTFILTVCFGSAYCRRADKIGMKALALKALATFMPVILATYGVFCQGEAVNWLIFMGTLLCMTADVLLEIYFIAGASAFGLAHVCFIMAFAMDGGAEWITIIIFILIYVGIIYGFRKEIPGLSRMKIPAFLYMAALSVMASMGITVLIAKGGMSGVMAAVGGIFFVCSDCILGFRLIHKRKEKIYRYAIMSLYYGAVYLIAASGVFLGRQIF